MDEEKLTQVKNERKKQTSRQDEQPMQKVENNEKLGVYKSMKREDGARTTE